MVPGEQLVDPPRPGGEDPGPGGRRALINSPEKVNN